MVGQFKILYKPILRELGLAHDGNFEFNFDRVLIKHFMFSPLKMTQVVPFCVPKGIGT